MAEELLETVEKLQSRLSDSQEPRKLLKTLKRLGELPMTVDILVETGVGKTVNSLRKHDVVGETAKILVAKWKKLVPQSSDSRTSSSKEGHSHSRTDKTSGYKRPRKPSPPPVREEDEEEEEEEEEEDYKHNYSPSPPQHYSLPYSYENSGGYQSEEYESPVEEPVPSPPRKQSRHKEPSRVHGSSTEQEKRRRPAQAPSEKRIRSNEREQKGPATHSSSKHSYHSSLQDSKKEKKRGNDGKEKKEKPEPKRDDGDDEESFRAPTMSFESFLTYDEPSTSKKKKKAPRAAQHVIPSPSVSSKSSKANGSCRKRSEPSHTAVSTPTLLEKRKKVSDMVPTLPDIPLPAIQPNYRPLPSIDVTPLSPQRRKVPVLCDEEDAGFTGRRFNSKMVVYSGSKTSYLPKMMTLYEQCIRVLQNNIDSIDEVGGVPFEILEPVLERCTPEQLYRIEQCNQYFTEESDDLWMRHCQRDFKSESPQEYESWREMYLRLYQEREDRLRKLTQNISSAHANKPKGRQVKMAFVNSAAKPPRDVRRRQEKYGTKDGSSSISISAASPSPVRIRPAMSQSSQGQSSNSGQSSFNSPPESSHSHTPSSSVGHSSRDKPQVKKIAPMMAKTIKAFKNRFSRR